MIDEGWGVTPSVFVPGAFRASEGVHPSLPLPSFFFLFLFLLFSASPILTYLLTLFTYLTLSSLLSSHNMTSNNPQRVPATKSAMHPILKKLVHAPDTFTTEDATIATKEIMEGRATHAQIGAYLVALKLNKLDAEPAIVASCAVEMSNHGLPIPFESKPELQSQLVDIVGTGGDGHDTFNVSTTAAIVAAGAGCKVAKVTFPKTKWL